MSAYSDICKVFGRPHVDVFDEHSYRVVLWDWHKHQGAVSSQICGYGTSLEEACTALIFWVRQPTVTVERGQCTDACFEKYQRSAQGQQARKEAREELGIKMPENEK